MSEIEPTTAKQWHARLIAAEREAGVTSRRGLRQRQSQVLAAYQETWNQTRATEAAGVSRPRLVVWRRDDPIFADAWADAEHAVADRVRGEVFHRAVHGVEVVVRDRHGVQVGIERKPSDRLLLALAKALDPVHFGEGRQDRHAGMPLGEVLVSLQAQPDLFAELERIADRLVGADAPSLPSKVIDLPMPELPSGDLTPPVEPRWSPEEESLRDRLNGRQPRHQWNDPDSPDAA